MTVDELCGRMSAAEMLRWELLENIDPWGQSRTDYIAAIICKTVYEAFCKNPPRFEKILKQFDFCPAAQTAEEARTVIEAIAG